MTLPDVIVITRPEPDASRTAGILQEMGLACLVHPLIETQTLRPDDDEVRALFACDWLLVTSRNCARRIADLVASSRESGADRPAFAIAAIHEGSGEALREAGLAPDRILAAQNAEAAAHILVSELTERPLRIGYPCSLQADTQWAGTPALKGTEIIRVPLYSTVAKHGPGDDQERAFWQSPAFDCVLLASPTGVRALHALRPLNTFGREIAFAAIGRTTARAIQECGRAPDVVPSEPTLPALAEALLHWRDARRRS